MKTEKVGVAEPENNSAEELSETDGRFNAESIAELMDKDPEPEKPESEEEETPEGEEKPEGEEQPVELESAEDEGEEGEEKPEEEEPPEDDDEKVMKGLDDKTQASINKRIGKLVGREKEAIAARDAAQAEAQQLKEQVTVLQQQLQSVDVNAVAKAAGINPLLLTENPQEIAKRERMIADFEKWAIKHWDGYEGTDDEKDPSYTAEQIRSRYAELREEAVQTIPHAKQLLAQRAQFNAAAKEIYPELLDTKSQQHQIVQQVFKTIPQLRTLPNALILIGDMLAGEKARLEQAKKKGKPTPPPRAPAAPKPAPSSSIKPKPEKKGFNMKGLAERGFDQDAVAEALD